jgi:hypothetical protein
MRQVKAGLEVRLKEFETRCNEAEARQAATMRQAEELALQHTAREVHACI